MKRAKTYLSVAKSLVDKVPPVALNETYILFRFGGKIFNWASCRLLPLLWKRLLWCHIYSSLVIYRVLNNVAWVFYDSVHVTSACSLSAFNNSFLFNVFLFFVSRQYVIKLEFIWMSIFFQIFSSKVIQFRDPFPFYWCYLLLANVIFVIIAYVLRGNCSWSLPKAPAVCSSLQNALF